MSTPRLPLYQRLPEIYRIRDGEQFPQGQLEAYLGVLDEVLAGLRDNIEGLYHDFFVETCDDWVIAYLADLLGTSQLSGDPWTLRADVARTVFHRRRKGTLGAIESLAYTLTGWAAQAVELRNRMVWNQHLNHQRPDAGGPPPLRFRDSITSAVRGGTVTLRDPALLTFLDGPFDPFAHLGDVKPGQVGSPRYNLPNLGVFLWRLKDYLVPVADPGSALPSLVLAPDAGEAVAVVRCILHPLGDPMILFNTHRYRADDDPPELSRPDEVPGVMPWPRLSSGSPNGNSDAYVRVDAYPGALPDAPGAASPGLVLHIPDSIAAPAGWSFRGANLCAWEEGLNPPVAPFEIVVDPDRGRVLFGLSDLAAEATPLADGLFASYTYAAGGPTGAHPISRDPLPAEWLDSVPEIAQIDRSSGAAALEAALGDLQDPTDPPLIIEIQDSATYTLDLSAVANVENVAGVVSLRLARPVRIRAATGQRPVVVLQRPLRFRPDDVLGAGAADVMGGLEVYLEGLYLTWDRASVEFAALDSPLIARAALSKVTLDGCTLDPGGAWQLDGSATGARQDPRPRFELDNDFGFAPGAELDAFNQVPEIVINRSVVGAVLADDGYRLTVTGSIVDGGSGVGATAPAPAIGAATDPVNGWGPELTFAGTTCFGRVSVERLSGEGGVFIHRIEAHDNQYGCVKFSCFSGDADRLPPHHGCVFQTDADLSFDADWFGLPGYACLDLRADSRLHEQGPGRDAMGAFGYLLNTHKWKNLNIRFREFMPVGVRPILIPVT